MGKFTGIATSAIIALAMCGGVAQAQLTQQNINTTEQALDQLMTLSMLQPLMRVVATEGSRHGHSLEAKLFPGKGGAKWGRVVARIQNPDRLAQMVASSLGELLSPEDTLAATQFLESDVGRRLVEREVVARRMMLDQRVETEAKVAAASLQLAATARAVLVQEVIEALDLVSINVSGGLNANFAFYRGLLDGGAMEKGLTERDLLSIVMEQEDEIRAATQNWLQAYLTLAYAPLSDDDLLAYMAFARTDAGRRYNAAIFQGFGQVFETTSYDLAREAARVMVRADI